MSEEVKVADTFNKLFSTVVKELKIEKGGNLLTEVTEETDLVPKAIKKYKNHPSLLNIQKYFHLNILMLRTSKGISII